MKDQSDVLKTAEILPDVIADVLLRIRADDASARCQLGNKYGCEPGDDAVAMLRAAREFRLSVVGVSFHVVPDAVAQIIDIVETCPSSCAAARFWYALYAGVRDREVHAATCKPICAAELQGSGAKDPAAFAAAIAKAHAVCDAGTALGFDMNTVDIGGGYVSCAEPGV